MKDDQDVIQDLMVRMLGDDALVRLAKNLWTSTKLGTPGPESLAWERLALGSPEARAVARAAVERGLAELGPKRVHVEDLGPVRT